jgi:hypothetical protein
VKTKQTTRATARANSRNTETRRGENGVVSATALFLEPASTFETRELQPLPDGSEAAWDRWTIELAGAGFLSWRAASQQSARAPALRTSEDLRDTKSQEPMKTQDGESKPLRPHIGSISSRAVTVILAAGVLLLGLGGLSQQRAQGQTLSPTAGSNSVTAPISTQFEQQLRLLLQMATADPVLEALLTKHQLTLQYSVSDLGLNLYVGFNGVRMVGAFGLPAQRPQLLLVSDAVTLHRLLSGEFCDSEMKVTVHLGLRRKLRLSRDLEQIQAALTRVYTRACRGVLGGAN